MILTKTNINTVPFHTALSMQSHKPSYASKLIIPFDANKLPPFQIILKQEGYIAARILIYDKYDNFLKELINPDNIQFNYYTISAESRLLYCKSLELQEDVHSDFYYVKIIYGTQSFYSDLIYPAKDLSNAICFEYWNITDQSIGDYIIVGKPNGYQFKFKAYFSGVIGAAEYPYEDEIVSRDGTDYIIHMTSKKTFKFNFISNENQMDALRIARTADKIQITYKEKVYDVISLDFENPEWSDDGLCIVNVEFSTDILARKTAIAQPTRGDSNEDYNNDYLNI